MGDFYGHNFLEFEILIRIGKDKFNYEGIKSVWVERIRDAN